MDSDDAVHYNNMREFGDFIEAMSTDQFIAWVYRCYSVSPEEALSIEESYSEYQESRSGSRIRWG